jgi:hypothetical protein
MKMKTMMVGLVLACVVGGISADSAAQKATFDVARKAYDAARSTAGKDAKNAFEAVMKESKVTFDASKTTFDTAMTQIKVPFDAACKVYNAARIKAGKAAHTTFAKEMKQPQATYDTAKAATDKAIKKLETPFDAASKVYDKARTEASKESHTTFALAMKESNATFAAASKIHDAAIAKAEKEAKAKFHDVIKEAKAHYDTAKAAFDAAMKLHQ